MGMDLVTADEHLAPAVLTAAKEFASAAVAGGWYLLQFNPHRVTGRVISMPPGPDRVGYLTRVDPDTGSTAPRPADPTAAEAQKELGGRVEMARSWLDTDPAIVWTPSSDLVGLTVRRCIGADLPGPATALRVLTCRRAVQYRLELSLHPSASGTVYSALFERTD